jgi:hypothetical protein
MSQEVTRRFSSERSQSAGTICGTICKSNSLGKMRLGTICGTISQLWDDFIFTFPRQNAAWDDLLRKFHPACDQAQLSNSKTHQLSNSEVCQNGTNFFLSGDLVNKP